MISIRAFLITGFLILMALIESQAQKASSNGNSLHLGLFVKPNFGMSAPMFYQSEIDGVVDFFLEDKEIGKLLTGSEDAQFVRDFSLPLLITQNADVTFNPELGMYLQKSIVPGFEAMLSLSYSNAELSIPMAIRYVITETGTGGTMTSNVIIGDYDYNREWSRINFQVGMLYYFLQGRLNAGVKMGITSQFNSSQEIYIENGTNRLDIEDPVGLLNQHFFNIGPVFDLELNDRLSFDISMELNAVLADGNLPAPQLCGMAGVKYRFGSGDVIEINTEEDDGEGPVNEAMKEELELRKRIRERMMDGQAVETERQSEFPEPDYESEKDMNNYFDPNSEEYEPTAGKLQAEFFHAVKTLANSDSLMREFRKLSKEEAQKVVDAMYASSRAASAEYWEDVARHNREYEEAYELERAKFREEFAKEWGRLQWQFLEPILDPAGAAVNLAEETGVIDKSTAEAIRLASMFATPSGMLLRGVRNGAKKLLKTTRKNADNQIDELAGAASQTARNNTNSFVRGSLRTIEENAGIAKKHAEAFQDIAKERDWIVVVRKGNPKSLGHHCGRKHIPKPVTCKAKTAKVGPNEGLVVNPNNAHQTGYYADAIKKARENGNVAEAIRLKEEYESAVKTYNKWLDAHNGKLPRGYQETAQGEILYRGNRIHGDYDLHGVFRKNSDGGRDRVNFGDGSLGDGRRQQKYINDKLGRDQCQHGGQEDWVKFNENTGLPVRADADPPVVVFKPDGSIIELNTKKDMIDFYKTHDIPIPVSWTEIVK